MPTTKATPAANNPPTIHDNKTGKPNPPRKPVLAGSTDSMLSIAGADINLNIIISFLETYNKEFL